MKVFRNATVYLEGRGLVKTDLSFDARIRDLEKALPGEEIFLPSGAIVLPGFIDEHIHGAAGCDGMDGTKESLMALSKVLPKEGTTSFLVTTMTSEPETLCRALSAVADYGDKVDGARILGVHLEGPFLSPSYAGAQASEQLAPCSWNLFDRFQTAASGKIRLVTLAPELPGALELIKYQKQSGIVVSLGHSAASYEEALAAVAAGADSITHTYNAMSPFTHRSPGLVGAALLSDDLYCELICDKKHVALPAIELLLKNKPEGKIILVTDSMRAKYLPDGISELGGKTVLVKDGEARLENGRLAGSLLKMNEAVKNLASLSSCDLLYAVDCATKNPAIHLGIYDECGSIALGKRADFAVLDKSFHVLFTYVGGERVF